MKDQVIDRVAKATREVIAARASDNPSDPQVREILEKLEKAQSYAEAYVERHYELHPEKRWFNLLPGADVRLREIPDEAMRRYKWFFDRGPDREEIDKRYGGMFSHLGETFTHDASGSNRWEVVLPWESGCDISTVAISTSRTRHRWIVRGQQSCVDVMSEIENDKHCDLELFGRHMCDGIDSIVFPIDRGDMVIFAHICQPCINRHLEENAINAQKCEIQREYNDGFGSLGWRLDENEHLWSPTRF